MDGAHRVGGQRTGGRTHDLREIDRGDDLAGDSDEIDPRDGSVQVDPPDHDIQVNKPYHGIQVNAAHRRVQVHTAYDGGQVHARHQRVEVNVCAHHLGEVEHGEHRLHRPDHHALQQHQGLRHAARGPTCIGQFTASPHR